MRKIILSIAFIATIALVGNLYIVNAAEGPTIMISLQDDGFVNVEIKDLNENVQNAINEIADTYDLTLVQYNSEIDITKVTGTSKEDQSEQVFLLDNEGKAADLQNE